MSPDNPESLSITFYLQQLSDSLRDIRKDISDIKTNMLTKDEFLNYKADVKFQIDELKVYQKESFLKIEKLQSDAIDNGNFRRNILTFAKTTGVALFVAALSLATFFIQAIWSLNHHMPVKIGEAVHQIVATVLPPEP